LEALTRGRLRVLEKLFTVWRPVFLKQDGTGAKEKPGAWPSSFLWSGRRVRR